MNIIRLGVLLYMYMYTGICIGIFKGFRNRGPSLIILITLHVLGSHTGSHNVDFVRFRKISYDFVRFPIKKIEDLLQHKIWISERNIKTFKILSIDSCRLKLLIFCSKFSQSIQFGSGSPRRYY